MVRLYDLCFGTASNHTSDINELCYSLFDGRKYQGAIMLSALLIFTTWTNPRYGAGHKISIMNIKRMNNIKFPLAT